MSMIGIFLPHKHRIPFFLEIQTDLPFIIHPFQQRQVNFYWKKLLTPLKNPGQNRFLAINFLLFNLT